MAWGTARHALHPLVARPITSIGTHIALPILPALQLILFLFSYVSIAFSGLHPGLSRQVLRFLENVHISSHRVLTRTAGIQPGHLIDRHRATRARTRHVSSEQNIGRSSDLFMVATSVIFASELRGSVRTSPAFPYPYLPSSEPLLAEVSLVSKRCICSIRTMPCRVLDSRL